MSWLSDLVGSISGPQNWLAKQFASQVAKPSMTNLRINQFLPSNTRPPGSVSPENVQKILGGLGGLHEGMTRPFRQQQEGSSIQDIIARLEALQDPSRYTMEDSLLRQQARAAASAQYDPVISQLRSQKGLSEQRAGRQKEELGQMFSTLSGSLEADIPRIAETFQGTKQATEGRYQNLKDTITKQYAQSQAEQEEMYKRLNIEAAAPEILPDQQRDRDYFANIAETEKATQLEALGQEERGAQEFTRRGSEIARTEGTQRQANLMDELRQLLASYDAQIGANETAKMAAEQAGYGSLVEQMQERSQKSAQRDFENALSTIKLGQDLQESQLRQMTGQFPQKVSGLGDVAGRAMGLGLQRPQAQNVQNIFAQTLGSDPSILAGIDSGSGVNLSKEALAQRIVEAGRARGMSPQEINALQVMALEYFGRS